MCVVIRICCICICLPIRVWLRETIDARMVCMDKLADGSMDACMHEWLDEWT